MAIKKTARKNSDESLRQRSTRNSSEAALSQLTVPKSNDGMLMSVEGKHRMDHETDEEPSDMSNYNEEEDLEEIEDENEGGGKGKMFAIIGVIAVILIIIIAACACKGKAEDPAAGDGKAGGLVSTDPSSPKPSSGLGTGAIVGIVVGVAALGAIIGVIICAAVPCACFASDTTTATGEHCISARDTATDTAKSTTFGTTCAALTTLATCAAAGTSAQCRWVPTTTQQATTQHCIQNVALKTTLTPASAGATGAVYTLQWANNTDVVDTTTATMKSVLTNTTATTGTTGFDSTSTNYAYTIAFNGTYAAATNTTCTGLSTEATCIDNTACAFLSTYYGANTTNSYCVSSTAATTTTYTKAQACMAHYDQYACTNDTANDCTWGTALQVSSSS